MSGAERRLRSTLAPPRPNGEPVKLSIDRSRRVRVVRVAMAGAVIACWLGAGLIDLVLSVMFRGLSGSSPAPR